MLNFALEMSRAVDYLSSEPDVSEAPEFDRNQTSRCLVLFDGEHGHVTYCVGWDLQLELDECGSHDVADLGLTPPGEGLWVWNGIYRRVFGSYWDDPVPDSEPDGEFRRPCDEELRRLIVGVPPWDASDWYVRKDS